jgi:hypothetical protein
VFHVLTVYYLFIVECLQFRQYIIEDVIILLCIIFRLTYKADQKDNIFKNNEDDNVAQKNKDECNNIVKEESIKTIDTV